jgi:hypothetical protein
MHLLAQPPVQLSNQDAKFRGYCERLRGAARASFGVHTRILAYMKDNYQG